MTFIHFQNPQILYLLLLVLPLLGIFFFYALRKRKQAVQQFSVAHDSTHSMKRQFIFDVGVFLSVALIIIALAQPAWNRKIEKVNKQGRDIVFLLDVSKSMLAEDRVPNRLDNAKLAISECLETLTGDRVALIAFAGSAEIRCPLTVDYDYFRMALRNATPDSLSLGGTQLSNAIQKATDKLLTPEKSGMQDLILISDGGDQESKPEAAIKELADYGARLIAIGVGDKNKGERIKLHDEETDREFFLKHKGREVWTRLDPKSLQQAVDLLPSSVYIEVGTSNFNLPSIYKQVMSGLNIQDSASQEVENYEEKFQLFIGAALLILIGTMFMDNRRKKSNSVSVGTSILVCFLMSSSTSPAQKSAVDYFEAGNIELQKKSFEKATDAFLKAGELAPQSPAAQYNLGNAYYQNQEFEAAFEAFQYSVEMARTLDLQSRSLYNMGNCLFQSAKRMQTENAELSVEIFRQAAMHYRWALDNNSSLKNAAYNLELARLIATQIEKEVQQQKEEEEQQKQQIQKIAEILKELIKRQETALSNVLSLLKKSTAASLKTQSSKAEQQSIEADTRKLIKTIESTGLHKILKVADQITSVPLQQTHTHLLKAVEAQKLAVEYLNKPELDRTVPSQNLALKELIEALNAIPEDQLSQDGESGDESSDEEGDEEGDWEEGEGEEGNEFIDSENPFGDFSDYEEIRGVPPPNRSEKEILDEEKMNQTQRKQKRAGSYKAVDKDW